MWHHLHHTYILLCVVLKTIQSIIVKDMSSYILLTGFGYLLAIIRPKTCGSNITGYHKNTLLSIQVKLIPLVIKKEEI